MIILDILICLLVVFCGFQFKKLFKNLDNYDKRLLNKLFVCHILIGLFFYYYLVSFGGDPTMYWFIGSTENMNISDVLFAMERNSATAYILFLNYLPAKVLELSFFTGNVIYNMLGFMGFTYFYLIIKENIPNVHYLKRIKLIGIPIFPSLLFLPNLHFWISGISKDTLLFLSVTLFMYSIKHIRMRFAGIAIAILLSIFIRPHISLFLLVAFGTAFAIDGKLKNYQKALIFLLFVAGFFIMYDYVLRFVQLDSLDAATVQKYSDTKSSQLAQDSGSGIDISSYPYPLKVFTFLYRPLFIDGLGILSLVASVENLLLLLFSVKLMNKKSLRSFRNGSFVIKGIFIFFVIGSLSFSLILGNLGIMLRQKTPFIMALLIFGFWVLSSQYIPKRKIYS